jgi:hypothetical protein
VDEGFEVSLSWGLVFVSILILEDCEWRIRTSYTHSRPDVYLNRRFLRQFIASLYFDWPVDGTDDRVAIVCVCRGAVGAIQMRECNCRGDHRVCIYRVCARCDN